MNIINCYLIKSSAREALKDPRFTEWVHPKIKDELYSNRIIPIYLLSNTKLDNNPTNMQCLDYCVFSKCLYFNFRNKLYMATILTGHEFGWPFREDICQTVVFIEIDNITDSLEQIKQRQLKWFDNLRNGDNGDPFQRPGINVS